MMKLGWFGNLLGELVGAILYCAALAFVAWLGNEPQPPNWAFFLAACLGIFGWSRPSYRRIQDFYE